MDEKAISENESPQQNTDSAELGNDIYTMPEEFYAPQQKGSKRRFYVLIGGVILILVFGGATAYVLLTKDTPVIQEVGINDVIQPAATDEQDVISSVEEDLTIIEQPEEPEEIITESLDAGERETIDRATALPTSIDLDNDGLTDIEEALLGIDPVKPDTDGDGFLDGAELSAGFDPSQPIVNLSSSALFITYVNANPEFSVRIPASWAESRPEETNDTILFIALNNDTIIFNVLDNSAQDVLEVWFSKAYPERSTQELSTIMLGNRMSKQSVNRREVYIPLEKSVLVVSYDVGGKKEIAFPAIWNFILNSIVF